MKLNLLRSKPQKLSYAPIQLRYTEVYIKDGTLINGTVNPAVTAPPVSAATINVTGGGSSGGNLQAGTYYLKYTYVTANGETTPSPELGPFTVAAGNVPTLALPSLPGGVTSINIYLTATNGLTNSEVLYLTGVTTTLVNLYIPWVNTGVIPPDLNTTGGYAVGASTMTVLLTTSLPASLQFTIGGDYTHTVYRTISQVQTLGVTTSVTFAPALQQAVEAGETIVFGPHAIYVKIGEGNCTYTEKRPIVYVRDREQLNTVRLGPDEPVELKFEFTWEFITAISGSGTPTINDALKQTGEAASWVTSSSDPCEPYAVNLIFEYIPVCPGVEREVFTFNNFRYEDLMHDIKQAMVSVTGKANVKQATIVRAA